MRIYTVSKQQVFSSKCNVPSNVMQKHGLLLATRISAIVAEFFYRFSYLSWNNCGKQIYIEVNQVSTFIKCGHASI